MPAELTTILLIAANPVNRERLRVEEESRAIEEAIAGAEFGAQFVLEKHFATRAADLQQLLLKYRPQIVHFSSHGSAASEITLVDDSGNAFALPPAALSRLFAVFRPGIRCVLLNACYSEEQAAGIAANVDCVVGMSAAIGDSAAIAFSAGFYRALAFGQPVQAAFEQACLQIDLLALGDGEMPRLMADGAIATESVFVQLSAHKPADPSGDASDTQFTTTISGGQVGQIINIDQLDGGLSITSR